MSLKAIATALGISVTTVSRALGGFSDVAASTRERVEAEARRRGYRPNTQARRLKTGKTDAVGLVYPENDVPFNSGVFMDMVSCISRELAYHDIDLLLIADDEHTDCHNYMRLVESRRIDALIIAHTLDDDPRITHLHKAGIPFLALGRVPPGLPCAWFDFDNHAGTWQATQKLIALGHKSIALLSENSSHSYVIARRQGWLDALHEHGLEDSLLRMVSPTRRAGYLAVMELMSLPKPPTAIITDNDLSGDGAAMALQLRGRLSGKEAVSLVVYDGLPQDSIIELDVAAVIQSTRSLVGRQISDMVYQIINDASPESLQIVWEPVFYPGSTVHSPSF
ncbi:substrate-binding domain-containing protein [Escherichia coli]|uniref:substrate-binding domain-containing protein n=1 Tax=Escherichia coli TaxID=562 RepID=UPI0017AE8BBB|nr:LacI family DNA-binding transcriptional regulator [Escherichia coli]EGA0673589.1 LacI family DNA-binding transcriptional regulator [Escherichia coli]ELM7891017.1 substrate-binding domain-containing protein [Escherichia coli]HBA7686708.1 LacI family DNA-binding transcriptional regulator [Escherichia coli]HBA7856093.1 LacI family DNA-binding transcriptional regulator [Escherichia coli]